MITLYIKEHDGDCYLVRYAEDHEFRCICDRIIIKEDGCWCEICQNVVCCQCGCQDYKGTGWFVCLDCLDTPERIIDALLSSTLTSS